MAARTCGRRGILTPAAFDNAITVLMALGGSTNAVIHLLALAGRVGVELALERFDELSRRTPVVAERAARRRPPGRGARRAPAAFRR